MSRLHPVDTALRAANPVSEETVAGAAHDEAGRAAYARIVSTRRPLPQRRAVRRTAAALVSAAALAGVVVAATTLPGGEPAADLPAAPAPVSTGDPGEAVPLAEVPEPLRTLVTADPPVTPVPPVGAQVSDGLLLESLRRVVSVDENALWTVRSQAGELIHLTTGRGQVLSFGSAGEPPPAPFAMAFGYAGQRDRSMSLTGRVSPEVASLELIGPGGGRRSATIANGYFIFIVAPGEPVPVDHVARDPSGATIALRSPVLPPQTSAPLAPTAPVADNPGEAPPLADVPEHVRGFVTGVASPSFPNPPGGPGASFVPESLRRAAAADDHSLWTVRTVAGDLYWIAAGPRSLLGYGDVTAVQGSPFRAALDPAPGSRALLTGEAARAVASIEFTLSNGERRAAAVANGYFLLPYDPDVAVPTDHIARDAAGTAIPSGLAPPP